MGATSNQTNIRLGGNLLFLTAHLVNVIVMHFAVQKKIVREDKDLAKFHSLQYKYLTIWNLAFQLLHLGISVACDGALVLKVNKKYPYLEQLRKYKDFLFASILWPTTLLVVAIFWPLFTYNRELIFPSYIDRVLTMTSNHMMHSFIAVVVVWEILFTPRSPPKSHKWNLLHIAVLYVAYLVVIFDHYFNTGVWPYPMLHHIYGTIYFPALFVFIAILYLTIYYVQWPITAMLHKSKKNKTR